MNTEHTIVTLQGETMGTTWAVKVVCTPRSDAQALQAIVEDALDTVVVQMSTWRNDSQISLYNNSAPGTWFELPEEFHTVVCCALAVAKASNGAFDPTLGELVDLWGFGSKRLPRQVPSPNALAEARPTTSWQSLTQREAPSRLLQPGNVRLDLSAIAKGYAVDLVTEKLRAAGFKNTLVDVGGELFGSGYKPDGSRWQVLIDGSNESDSSKLEHCVLRLDNQAVATSGDRWHRFEHAEVSYSHTINPRSGHPVSADLAAVSVVAESAMLADAWATALTVMGASMGFEFASKHGFAARFLARSESGMAEHLTPAYAALVKQPSR